MAAWAGLGYYAARATARLCTRNRRAPSWPVSQRPRSAGIAAGNRSLHSRGHRRVLLRGTRRNPGRQCQAGSLRATGRSKVTRPVPAWPDGCGSARTWSCRRPLAWPLTPRRSWTWAPRCARGSSPTALIARLSQLPGAPVGPHRRAADRTCAPRTAGAKRARADRARRAGRGCCSDATRRESGAAFYACRSSASKAELVRRARSLGAGIRSAGVAATQTARA